jgi:hypothetical protein
MRQQPSLNFFLVTDTQTDGRSGSRHELNVHQATSYV